MKTKLLLFFMFICIATAFAQSGEIDATFGTAGKVINGMGTNVNSANCVVFQPDGKFLVGGTYISNYGNNDFALARYNANGALDVSFGTDGKVVTAFGNSNNNHIYSLYILPDGKILAYGITGTTSLTPKSVIVRYNSNGSIDTAFGTQGKVFSNLFPYSTSGNKLAIQPDGKIVLAAIKTHQDDPNYYFGVERYTADGAIDTTFGTNGQAVTSFGTGRSIPFSTIVQPDGKILVSGSYYQSSAIMGIMRFNTNGTLDASFDGDGKVTTSFGAGTYSEGIQAFMADSGKIILAGTVYGAATRSFGVVQYNANGSIDTGFDGDGKATSAYASDLDYSNINGVARLADGKFLVVAKPSDVMATASDFVVRRYNSNVTPDTGFGTNGRVQATIDTGLNEALSVAVSATDEILIAGSVRPADNSYNSSAVIKYSASGSLSTAFGNSGKVVTALEKATTA